MAIWDEFAPRYHKKWVNRMYGPVQSAENLIKAVGVREGDAVLDVACGTGLVTGMLSRAVGNTGVVVGADTSITAIRIAVMENVGSQNVSFVNADAENMTFAKRFDIITCQYALFFFPDAPRALRNMRMSLKKSGRMGIVVHRGRDKVPFYGAILAAAKKFIPDYVTEGTPQHDRYSTEKDLRDEVEKSGFTNTEIRNYAFEYSPGTFEEYWTNYIKYTQKDIRTKIDSLDRIKREEFKEEIRRNAMPYTDKRSGIITFPWQSMILTAVR